MLDPREGLVVHGEQQPRRLLDRVVAPLGERAVYGDAAHLTDRVDEAGLGDTDVEQTRLAGDHEPRPLRLCHGEGPASEQLLVDADAEGDGHLQQVDAALAREHRPSENAITEPLQSAAPRPRTTPSAASASHDHVGVTVSMCAVNSRVGREDQPISRSSAAPSTGVRATGRPQASHRDSRWSTASCSLSDGEGIATRSTSSLATHERASESFTRRVS